MTREEAIDRLKTEVKRIEEIMENGDFGCVDMDTWNEFAKKAEWRETLIELLTGPTPDPDTGLMPCGCGGKPVFIEFFDGFFDHERITCSECQIEFTTTSVGCGALLWNKAMGWRGDNES